ncbi:hypothetical protein DFH08DRAFT_950654 [Mycena albidolilacea]|uniref:Uncharacterized protein n=1 Tax=Mycena albidolilacea TaxID=1033008 RepID=A0AAD7ALD9_9AGAR|nr:hypothetical protein DFH08DRAFT_950654 [Mycena albidolilacea]
MNRSLAGSRVYCNHFRSLGGSWGPLVRGVVDLCWALLSVLRRDAPQNHRVITTPEFGNAAYSLPILVYSLRVSLPIFIYSLPVPVLLPYLSCEFGSPYLDQDLYEGVRVTKIKFSAENAQRSVTAEWKSDHGSGDIKFSWLVDASGRTGIMSTRYLKNRKFTQNRP